MGEALLFYLVSAFTIGGAVLVVTLKNPARALLSLLLSFFSLAVLFILLKAYFIAMVHLLVYAGAILVLFLFVIMLLGLKGDPGLARPSLFQCLGGLVLLALLGQFLWVVGATHTVLPEASGTVSGTIEAVGKLLFTKYLLPFELTGFLLLVGILGAVTLARKDGS